MSGKKTVRALVEVLTVTATLVVLNPSGVQRARADAPRAGVLLVPAMGVGCQSALVRGAMVGHVVSVRRLASARR